MWPGHGHVTPKLLGVYAKCLNTFNETALKFDKLWDSPDTIHIFFENGA